MTQLCRGACPAPYSVVLWGSSFEEAVAVIFVAAFRQAGLPVQVIGLMGPQATGVHGLALHPDMTLSDGLPLASQILCVLIPCNASLTGRIENDPRIITFFAEAARNGALFIVSDRNAIAMTSLQYLAIQPTHIVTYATHQNLIELARTVALRLKARTATG